MRGSRLLTSANHRTSLRRTLAAIAVAAAVAIPLYGAAAAAKERSKADRQKADNKARGVARKAPAERVLVAQSDGRQRKAPGGAIVQDGGSTERTRQEYVPGMREPRSAGKPRVLAMQRAASADIDLRDLPLLPPDRVRERPEIPAPLMRASGSGRSAPIGSGMPLGPSAPAPAPLLTFAGLDRPNFGAGFPPDTNGDVGPTYYIQTINTSIGIYRKSDGFREAAFTFDTFLSQGNFGNLCDTDNLGDPVVLYDTFEDRWVITDFAFTLDGSGNVVNPPGAFECFAVSRTNDPLTGGWNFYSINTTDGLADYPKLGIWPDGIYMSANMFGFVGFPYQTARAWAFNKAQMYAGAQTVQVVSFDEPDEFTMLPANARLQAGSPPAGSPNYFSVVWNFLNVISVYKFQVDWVNTPNSTFTGPFNAVAPSSWAAPPGTVPSGGNNLDTLAVRLMMQNQYTNIGGVESLWNSHTVQGSSASQSAVRYYQVAVTGGTVSSTTTQAATWNPDSTNRLMPSLAVDRAGNMAIGYSATSASVFPAIRYAGRLSTDPANTLGQTEQTMFDGTGSQSGLCGSGSCERWGDYSAMTLDPDGCTFWYTNEYYAASGLDYQTRIGSFKFAECTPITAGGTLQGTVTDASTSNPKSGVTMTLGSRTATTNGSGVYSFTDLPAGTYPTLTASAPGFNTGTASNVVVNQGGTTTQNFSLGAAPTSGCFTDTTQADFQAAERTLVDHTTSPGNVLLQSVTGVDQQNTTVLSSGFGFNSTSWVAQSFTAGASGPLVSAELDLFCSSCSGTTPDLTVSVRATSGDLPTGADLASATVPGFSSGAAVYYTATFGTPVTLTAGTKYALVVRATSNPSAGTYAYVVSSGSVYGGGRRTTSSNSGSTWGLPTDNDLGFRTYIATGYAPSGNLASSLKDANPAGIGMWTTLAFNATTPANTSVSFQAAGSNSPTGPFSYVGPDGTTGTFFGSGASLAQFNGNRYLKYKAILGTSNSSVTPMLNDVTVCFGPTLSAPTVTSPTSASVTSTTATLGGNVTSDGGATVTERGVVYSMTSTNADPSIGGPGVTQVATSGTTGVFTVPVSGLTPATGYSFKAYATNSVGTGYTSPASTFTTSAPGPPTLDAVSGGAITVGATNTLTGTNFTAGTVIKLFVNTGSSIDDVAPSGFTPTSSMPSSLTWDIPTTVPLGQGFGSIFVVNTDQGFTTSNTQYTLLYGDGADNIPTVTSVNGMALSSTLDPGVPVAHSDTVVAPGASVTLGGTGFNNPGVNLFASATSDPDPAPTATPCGVANYGPAFPGGSATSFSFTVPAGVPAGPANFQVVNDPYTGNVQSNSVSSVAGATPTITSVSVSGGTVTILGTGFSCLSVINLFNVQGPSVVNLGGLSGSQRAVPLQFISSTELRFEVPAGAQAGPAFVEVLNPPFIPFSSSGNDPDGAFTFP